MKQKQSDFTIGHLSERTDCNIETIRYYERIGIMPAPPRSNGGRRIYQHDHIKRLMFIRRSRELGFSIAEIRALLSLVDEGSYSCGEIQTLTIEHIKNIKNKIADLKKLEKTLSRIASQCKADDIPECPIIDALFEDELSTK